MKALSICFAVSFSFFLTLKTSGQVLKDSRDGKEYPTVNIGGKTWMAKNLAYCEPVDDAKAWDGLVTNVKNYTACYDYTLNYCEKYGMLYSWTAAQNACPAGWHLPSKAEADSLILSLGKKGERYVNLIRYWTGPDLFGGRIYSPEYSRFISLRSEGINKFAAFWTATEERDNYKYLLYVNKAHKTVRVNTSGGNIGASIRCVKNN